MASCREKRNIMMPTKEFWSKKQFTDSSSMEQWILARRNIRKFISPSLLICSCFMTYLNLNLVGFQVTIGNKIRPIRLI